MQLYCQAHYVGHHTLLHAVGKGSADGQTRGMVGGEVFVDGLNRGRLRGRRVRWRLVGSVPACPTVSPCKGASISNRCASYAMHKHFYTWKRFLCGWGMCPLQMETSPLRMGTCSLRMETPLRGRSGGHTGAAPTISHVAPCPKIAGEVFADRQR